MSGAVSQLVLIGCGEVVRVKVKEVDINGDPGTGSAPTPFAGTSSSQEIPIAANAAVLVLGKRL